MSVQEWYEPECDECGCYHCKRLICEDCAKELFGTPKSRNKSEDEK